MAFWTPSPSPSPSPSPLGRRHERRGIQLAVKLGGVLSAVLLCWAGLYVPFSRPPPPPCTGFCLASQPVLNGTVRWTNGTAEGWAEPLLLVAGVPLHRFSSAQAAQCLASSNHSLVFVGDSITRYQYISLVNFLEHGQWPGFNASGTATGPSPVVEKASERSTHLRFDPGQPPLPAPLLATRSAACWGDSGGVAAGAWWRRTLGPRPPPSPAALPPPTPTPAHPPCRTGTPGGTTTMAPPQRWRGRRSATATVTRTRRGSGRRGWWRTGGTP